MIKPVYDPPACHLFGAAVGRVKGGAPGEPEREGQRVAHSHDLHAPPAPQINISAGAFCELVQKKAGLEFRVTWRITCASAMFGWALGSWSAAITAA